ncbi:MAG TPA: SUMF1/EgtB/PvdO family nonheme iron enzyme, partial [Candidatus Caenarcaniphilales bacterium]
MLEQRLRKQMFILTCTLSVAPSGCVNPSAMNLNKSTVEPQLAQNSIAAHKIQQQPQPLAYNQPKKPRSFPIPESAVYGQASARKTSMEFVLVDNPNNPIDSATNSGNVAYIFEIGKFEVTNAQYVEFLNATAVSSDPYQLYNVNMDKGLFGGIKRREKGQRYVYEPLEGYANLPVVYVSWYDAARYCNWLHFGKPNTGKAVLGTTEGNSEIGAYNTAFFKTPREVQRVKTHNPGALYWIPTL